MSESCARTFGKSVGNKTSLIQVRSNRQKIDLSAIIPCTIYVPEKGRRGMKLALLYGSFVCCFSSGEVAIPNSEVVPNFQWINRKTSSSANRIAQFKRNFFGTTIPLNQRRSSSDDGDGPTGHLSLIRRWNSYTELASLDPFY